MQADIQELRDLPLKDLMSSPLEAAIKAQADAAMTTVAFIESVGLIAKETSFLDLDNSDDDTQYDVRMAKLKVQKTFPGSTTPVTTEVELPFISLFNVPAFEINNLEWDFNVKLKSIQTFSANLQTSTEVKTDTTANFQFNLRKMISIGGQTRVETTVKTDFDTKFGIGREQEYNLKIKVQANSAPLPKGISKLLDIAEAVANQTAPVEEEPE